MGTSIALAALAGLLSLLSPCVLPILPIVLGAATAEHRLGPLALAGGLSISFVMIGLLLALLGYSAGLDGDHVRLASALALVLVGLLLMVARLQDWFAAAVGPAGAWLSNRFGGRPARGLGGQFGLGLLIGAVWSPCVGPTLGAASVLAARGENLTEVAIIMVAFGVGAGLPLALFGLASQATLARSRQRMLQAGRTGKIVLGITLIATGLAVLTGLDKRVEAALLSSMPRWLVELTTRY